MNIIVTCGGTSEKIDQVRSITNTSTGKTATSIAESLIANGHSVFFLYAEKLKPLSGCIYNFSFSSSNDLDKILKDTLTNNEIDVIIHAAAVSDFTVHKVVINGELFDPETLNKIDSSDEIEVILKRRSKIIRNLKNYSKKFNPTVIGFKLTNCKEPEDRLTEILKLSETDSVDFVVHNDLSEISHSAHKTQIYCKDVKLFSGATKEELIKNILRLLDIITQNKILEKEMYA